MKEKQRLMMTKNEPGRPTGTTSSRRPKFTQGLFLLFVGVVLGAVVFSSPENQNPLITEGLFAAESGDLGGNTDGEYLFFTFRRNLWIVHQPTGKLQFLMLPDGSEETVIRSRIYEIDTDVFPVDQVQYQLSERNLTNFLWIMNPVTGKARYVRAGRAGGFDVSDVYSATRREG